MMQLKKGTKQSNKNSAWFNSRAKEAIQGKKGFFQ